ncbi:hypothetical protein [Lactobacillus helveticus]|uniref:hypothetical protein n=1 Tax=Lactobacillus helveticus TaxID=1587 RepID=UPI00062A5710|nr:hypothetical protein [Lactobacillus helveticus]AKG66654.1 hypothetical protein TU99_04880 [Lactobacillus helveticus]
MTVITDNPHMWFVCTNSEGKTQTVYNDEHYKHNYPFTFEVNFADVPTPQQNTVTLYNLTKEHRNFYSKKQHCYVAFNWGQDKKILAEGFISKIGVSQHDGTSDMFTLTFTEGTDYSNVSARKLKVKKTEKVNRYITKKVREQDKATKKRKLRKKRIKTRATKTKLVNKTFRKGTSYKALINGIATQSGIVISKIDLAKNPKLKRAFTAKGMPLNLLKQVVKKTGSIMTYIRGKLVIINPKNTKRTWYEIDDQDLISPPSYNESSDSDSGKGTWEIQVPLIPDITTNVGIHMMSKYLKGYYYVKAGQHTFDMDIAKTQCSLAKI